LAFIRHYEGQTCTVLLNFTGMVQMVTLSAPMTLLFSSADRATIGENEVLFPYEVVIISQTA